MLNGVHGPVSTNKYSVWNVTVPLEEQLDELRGTGERSVCRQEDPAVVQILAVGVQEVIH